MNPTRAGLKCISPHCFSRTSFYYQTFLFSENTRQIERFRTIFEDKQAQIKFHPCYTDLSQGFIDKDLQIVCYTDHQIFDRYHKYKTKAGFN